jgi:hypothetical protein
VDLHRLPCPALARVGGWVPLPRISGTVRSAIPGAWTAPLPSTARPFALARSPELGIALPKVRGAAGMVKSWLGVVLFLAQPHSASLTFAFPVGFPPVGLGMRAFGIRN